MLMDRIKNNDELKVDLENGVILELSYDEEIKAYRGYWKEENIYIGIWTKKTLVEIINGEMSNIKLLY